MTAHEPGTSGCFSLPLLKAVHVGVSSARIQSHNNAHPERQSKQNHIEHSSSPSRTQEAPSALVVLLATSNEYLTADLWVRQVSKCLAWAFAKRIRKPLPVMIDELVFSHWLDTPAMMTNTQLTTHRV